VKILDEWETRNEIFLSNHFERLNYNVNYISNLHSNITMWITIRKRYIGYSIRKCKCYMSETQDLRYFGKLFWKFK
jgi:hypothetical protein